MSARVALGLLASKVDKGEMDVREALERAYQIGLGDEAEPTTVRSAPQARAVVTPLELITPI